MAGENALEHRPAGLPAASKDSRRILHVKTYVAPWF